MAGPGNILIRIGAEASQALGEFDKVNGKMGETASRSQKVGSALKAAAVPATIALGAIAVGAKKAIDAASDLEKQVQKTTGVFGPSADTIVKWSEGLAKSFGLSSSEALSMANKFGNLFVNLGYSQKQAAGMSEQFTQLASDLASFNNVAMREGLYSGKGALDAHAKAAATMTLVLQQTSNAQGDFAKHSDDAANAQKIQAAETQNLTETLGKGLLPYYEAAEKLLIRLTDATSKHTTAVKIVIGATAALAAAILVANAAFKAYTIATNVAGVATKLFTAANRALVVSLATNPYVIAAVAIIAIGVALVEAYKHSETFRRIVHDALSDVAAVAHTLSSAFGAVERAASAAFSWIVDHWRAAAFAFGPLGAGLVLVVDHFDAIRSAASSAFGVVERAIQGVVAAVKTLIDLLGKIHVPHISLPSLPHIPHVAGASYGAPALVGVSSRGVSPQAAAVSSGGGLTVNFYGPTDPEGAARAIARVLRNHDVRQGRTR